MIMCPLNFCLYLVVSVFGSLSPMFIRFLNAKRTLVIAFVCHLLYTLSNFYPTFPTLLTSSLLLGIMAGPMWTAQGLYCTATGMAYAAVKQVLRKESKNKRKKIRLGGKVTCIESFNVSIWTQTSTNGTNMNVQAIETKWQSLFLKRQTTT